MKIKNRLKKAITKCLLVTSALCFSNTTAINAQAVAVLEDLKLSLNEAIEIALKNNSTYKVANENIKVKQNDYKEAWQKLLPEANVVGVLDHTLLAPEMKLNNMSFKMGKDNSNTVNGVLSINLPLFVPAVYKTMSMTKADIELAKEKSRGSKLELINQVTKAYYQMILAIESHNVIKRSYEVAEEQYNIIKNKFEKGLVSEYDKLTAEVQMNSLKPNLIATENAIEMANLQLKVLLNMRSFERISPTDDINKFVKEVSESEGIYHFINLSNNSEFKQMDLSQKMLDKSIGLAKTAFMPNISLGGSYKYQSLNNDNLDVLNYAWTNSASISLNISVPLFRASNYTKLRSARLQKSILEMNNNDIKNKIISQYQNFQNSMKAAKEQINANLMNISKAEKALEIANKRYEIGKGTIIEVNNAQVALTQVKLSYTQSLYDYLIAVTEMNKIIGKE